MKKNLIIISIILTLLSIGIIISQYQIEKDKDGNTIIKEDDKTYNIPKEVSVTLKDNNLVFENKNSLPIQFEFKNNKINLKKDSSITSFDNEGIITFKFKGIIDFNNLIDISEGELRINNEDKVIFADFIANSIQTYSFMNNDKEIKINSVKGSRIIFDLLKKEINGENIEAIIYNKKLGGEKVKIYLENKELPKKIDDGVGIISIDENGNVKSVGKVTYEDEDNIFKGLTDSTTFEKSIINDKVVIKIDGSEDRTLVEGGIAELITKIKVGDLLSETGFSKDLNIESIISREKGILSLDVKTDSLNKLYEIQDSETKYALLTNNFEVNIGKQGVLNLENDFGMIYKNTLTGKNLQILSPVNARKYLGNDIDTLKNIIKSQSNYNEKLGIKTTSLNKLFNLMKKETDTTDKVLRYDSAVQSFNDIKQLIDSSFENDLEKKVIKSSFILENIESIPLDYLKKDNKLIRDSQQETYLIELRRDSIKEAREILESVNYLKSNDLEQFDKNLLEIVSNNPKIDGEQVKSLMQRQLLNKVKLEMLSESYISSYKHDSDVIIDSYKSFLRLEDSTLKIIEGIPTIVRDDNTLTLSKLSVGKSLINQLSLQGKNADALQVLNNLVKSIDSYQNNPGGTTSDIYTLDDESKKQLEALKLGLKDDWKSVVLSAMNRIQMDLYTQKETLESLSRKFEGYSDKVDKADSTLGKIGMAIVSGGILKELNILDFIGNYREVESASVELNVENLEQSQGIYAIQTLVSMGIPSQTINDWMDGKLSGELKEKLIVDMLVLSKQYVEDPKISPEYPGVMISDDNKPTNLKLFDIPDESGGLLATRKVAISEDHIKTVLNFLEDSREVADFTLTNSKYSDDLQKMLGLEAIVEKNSYESISPLDIDINLQNDLFKQRLGTLGSAAEIAIFVDDGLSPLSVAIGATTGGIGGTFFSSATGLVGGVLGVGENLLIDAATGASLVNLGLDPNDDSSLAMASALSIGLGTGFQRIFSSISNARAASKVGFKEFLQSTNEEKLMEIGLRKVGETLVDNAGREIKTSSGLTKYIDDLQIASENSLKVANAQRMIGDNYESITARTSGCFLADTKILMGDKNYKNIQDILIGEKVVAFDIDNNKFTEAEVTTTFVRKENRYRVIEYEILE
ncbi:MAG: Hint domain-containing protein [Candidatus Pacearchaeota archaeon]|jgi:hypothetical protein